MRPIISFIGKSGSGKTTLLEKLISELKQRGHKVAMVKHSHHAEDLDTASKDTWRFSRAGSELSAINSLDNLAIYRHMDHYLDPQEISDFILWDYDLILTEGFKSGSYPKIEVHSSELGKDLVVDPQQLLALVTDEPLETDVPQFSRNDVTKIADFIENILEKNNSDDIEMVVNGNQARIDTSLQDLLRRTIFAMVPEPNDNDEIKSLHIAFRRNN